PHFLGRFHREAQACGRLRHPNIINVTDFGIARGARGSVPYLVMEFLDGQTLSDFQKEHPLVPLPLAADLLDQIALALAEAHRHGIVHRDLKPDNIWLEPNGRGGFTVKVLDFGVAKLNLLGGWATPSAPSTASSSGAAVTTTDAGSAPTADETATIAMPAAATTSDEAETVAMNAASSNPALGSDSGSYGSDGGHTMPGSLVGTPAFMSPEQALGKEIDYRSDIYSLAVLAYSMVCGRLPFTGKTSELFAFHQSGHPAPPAEVHKIPPDVSAAILAGLAREPANRPQSALGFTRRLHNAVDAEFLALRRSKAFLMQHLGAFFLVMCFLYPVVLATVALVAWAGKKALPVAGVRIVVVPVIAAGLFVFFDNLLRAAAALMALDEQLRVRRFLAFRVFWRLLKASPKLAVTQAQALISFGAGWVLEDCLWPVVCVVERRSGRAAVERSRELMSGLRSAGRALAVRHLALASLAIAELVKSLSFLLRGAARGSNVQVTGSWFPVFALFAAAPLFLYDRTAAKESGPLLQLDRTPEVRLTLRPLSLSSTVWLIAGVVYMLWTPISQWIFG
ncbi:MAG TPA: serine/threonine-protein kinase, partial [Candidatus Solibacter sp.]|nr:serine/threonine-protein kinase [Candidatus Solibacter sp.]